MTGDSRRQPNSGIPIGESSPWWIAAFFGLVFIGLCAVPFYLVVHQ